MKKQLWLILIAVEVLILFAMLLADFGLIRTATAPLSPRSIILHITTVVIIFACRLIRKATDAGNLPIGYMIFRSKLWNDWALFMKSLI